MSGAAMLLIVVIGAVGCGDNRADNGAGSAPGMGRPEIGVTSSEFSEGGRLPDRYTC